MARRLRDSKGYVSPWYTWDNFNDFLSILYLGDRLEFDRGAYKHWAICVTEGEDAHVIHRTGDSSEYISGSLASDGRRMGIICLESLFTVLGENMVRINNYLDHSQTPQPIHDIVTRAVSAIDNEKVHGAYSLLRNNCEHFVNWCRYGTAHSRQVVVGSVITTATAIIVGATGVLVSAAIRYMRA